MVQWGSELLILPGQHYPLPIWGSQWKAVPAGLACPTPFQARMPVARSGL